MRITLRNTFHGTTAVVHAKPVWEDHRGRTYLGLSHRQVLRTRRKLCGIPDCMCGGIAGERGGRYWLDVTYQDPWTVTKNVYTLHDSTKGITQDDRLEA